jgi:hypothetical protein
MEKISEDPKTLEFLEDENIAQGFPSFFEIINDYLSLCKRLSLTV